MGNDMATILRAELSDLSKGLIEAQKNTDHAKKVAATMEKEVEVMQCRQQALTKLMIEYGIEYNDIWQEVYHNAK